MNWSKTKRNQKSVQNKAQPLESYCSYPLYLFRHTHEKYYEKGQMI